MWWWCCTAVGSAAEVEVPIAVSLPVGEPARGALSLTVPLPSRIPRTERVKAEVDGFVVVCSGQGRDAVVELSFDLERVPAHLPERVRCEVGAHGVVLALTNDRELEPVHQLRLDQGFGVFPLPAGDWADGVGRVLDPGEQPSEALVCRIQKGMLWTEVRDGLVPGSYRCVFVGHEPLVIEVLPAG